MNFQGFSVRHLAVLDILFTERHVGRAADRLGLSQPAVSNTLAWLRDHFGDPLLVRSGGVLRLTPFAEHMREPVRRLLVDFRTVITNRPIFDPSTATSRFRIVMSHYTCAVLLPHLLRLFSRYAPEAELEVSNIEGDIHEFRRGEVDLVIVPHEFMFPYNSYEALFTDRWICAASASFWRQEERPDFEHYCNTRHVIPDQPQSLSLDLQQHGINRKVAAILPYALVFHSLANTPWLATMPEQWLKIYRNKEDFRIFPLPFATRPIRMNQQWHPEANDDASIAWLRTVVKEATFHAGLSSPSLSFMANEDDNNL